MIESKIDVDSEFGQNVITEARTALQTYLQKQSIKEDDKIKMQHFITELSELRNIQHLLEVINEMEAVQIRSKDNQSIYELIDEKDNRCLSEELKESFGIVDAKASSQGSLFPGLDQLSIFQKMLMIAPKIYSGGSKSNVHFENQLIEAHQVLMKIVPDYVSALENHGIMEI